MGPVTVVFDTNVVISAAGFGGLPEECIIRAFQDDVNVATAPNLLDELDRVLQYDHLPFGENDREEIPFVFLHLTDADIIEPDESLAVFDDQDDDKFLECAVETGADYLVSGDEGRVQAVDVHRGVRIVSPRAFLAEVEEDD